MASNPLRRKKVKKKQKERETQVGKNPNGSRTGREEKRYSPLRSRIPDTIGNSPRRTHNRGGEEKKNL